MVQEWLITESIMKNESHPSQGNHLAFHFNAGFYIG